LELIMDGGEEGKGYRGRRETGIEEWRERGIEE
jgi:hypothetical protein